VASEVEAFDLWDDVANVVGGQQLPGLIVCKLDSGSAADPAEEWEWVVAGPGLEGVG
jgi:hypothetical protein